MAKSTGIFLGAQDLEVWLDALARKIFGVSGLEFARRYEGGHYRHDGVASDLASLIPLIRKEGSPDGRRRRRRDSRGGA